MATNITTMSVTTNAAEIAAQFKALAEYLEAAPDPDPAKIAMAEFGAVDLNEHILMHSSLCEGVVVVTMVPVPALQQIMDMAGVGLWR